MMRETNHSNIIINKYMNGFSEVSKNLAIDIDYENYLYYQNNYIERKLLARISNLIYIIFLQHFTRHAWIF